ncbi:MAG: protein-arginine deiminase family protein [Phycisphaerae bacterium]
MGSGVTHFADDWHGYHRLEGEVHCASGEVRALFSFNWWEHQP